jgi:hypothetical protein
MQSQRRRSLYILRMRMLLVGRDHFGGFTAFTIFATILAAFQMAWPILPMFMGAAPLPQAPGRSASR